MSSESSSSNERYSLLPHQANAIHKVKYHPDAEWDFFAQSGQEPIDCSLMLPHYRARHQPNGHRMNMFVRNESASIKLRVCRTLPRMNFYLEVQGGSANVTVWLPSDFKGHIRLPVSSSRRIIFSPAFHTHILQHVRINEELYHDGGEDEVVVRTTGKIAFKVWDIMTGAPEKNGVGSLRRVLRCLKKTPETPMNWDFLLDD